jgi:hypothetical protein
MIEVMITLALVGIFIVALSDMTLRVGAAGANSAEHGRLLTQIDSVLNKIKIDISSAYKVVAPTGVDESNLLLDTIPYNKTLPGPSGSRLLVDPYAPTVPFDPLNPTDLVSLEYRLDSGVLQSKMGTEPSTSLGPLDEFRTSLVGTGLYEIRLVFRTDTKRHELRGVVFRP